MVLADILCSDGTLYKGAINSYHLDKNGQLMGVLLTDAQRFRRDDYLKDRDKNPNEINRNEYWRSIPGTRFFVLGDKILNLNITYNVPPPDEKRIEELIFERLKPSLALRPLTITSITYEKPKAKKSEGQTSEG